ncbi:hypothetical protein ACI6QG_10700 [Roseococcus sp. DSY-14]|uniref:hypothetical protein n=1 Tax=Roseococcus sp. DSY-14 TaxID=3369650 RepID=UPI00387B29B7
MISSNSLAAFTQEISRARPAQGAAPAQRADAPFQATEVAAQRKLEAVPPAPATPVPRGSLLDLRV